MIDNSYFSIFQFKPYQPNLRHFEDAKKCSSFPFSMSIHFLTILVWRPEGSTTDLSGGGTKEDLLISDQQNYLAIKGHVFGIRGNRVVDGWRKNVTIPPRFQSPKLRLQGP